MSVVRAHVDIHAAPAQVFAFFDDIANASVIVPNLVAVTSVDPVDSGGRRVAYTTRNAKGEIVEASSEHLVYDPPHRTVTRGVQSGVETISTREFAPHGVGATRIVASIEWSVPVRYVAGLITAPLRRPLRRSLRAGLAAARDQLESGPASLGTE